MMLENISTDDLQAELERRKKVHSPKPAQVQIVNLEPLWKLCTAYINDLDEKGYVDEDHSHYIFEAAMEVFYGKGVWNWINSKI